MGVTKTYETVKKEVESKGAVLISEIYVSTLVPLKIRCKCGNVFERNLKSFKKGLGLCDFCTETQRRKSGRNFTKEEVDKLMKTYGLVLLTDFYKIKSTKTRLDVICKCGNKFKPTIYNLRKNESTKCQSCASYIEAKKRKKDLSEIEEIVKKYGGILLSKEYKDNKTELKIKCECGQIHYRRLNNILNYETAKCPLCKDKISKGELKLANILRKYKIEFETQKSFDGCKFKHSLKFDFYIPKLNLCIEYDGIQHFKPVDIFGQEEYELTKERDKIKNEFCKNNSINLLRISYKDFKNIEKILFNNKIIPSQAS